MDENQEQMPLDPYSGVRLCAGNKDLYLRMLARFLEDNTASSLKQALDSGRSEEAFLHAHTLKGVCAQLAMPALYACAEEMCTLLCRQKTCASGRAKEFAAALFEAHAMTLCTVRSYLQSQAKAR